MQCSSFFDRQRGSGRYHAPSPSSILGIAEWRDLDFGLRNEPQSEDKRLDRFPKSVCILPFPFEDVLLQGETKELQLYEDRFIKLYEDSLKKHAGVVAMGLLFEKGMIKEMPLCEIESHVKMEGFGVLVTIRCVGRAAIVDITQQNPYLEASCVEIFDNLPTDMKAHCNAAYKICEVALWLASSEFRLAETLKKGKPADDRIPLGVNDDEIDVDDEREPDRMDRFESARRAAYDYDTQGYQNVPEDNDEGFEFTMQTMTATCWAAFCMEKDPKQIALYRLQALITDCLSARLRLAVMLLLKRKSELTAQMRKAGLKVSNYDEGLFGR